MATSAPRTLADQLRSWSDVQLARLLELRPDLASPTPQDSAQLASRIGTRASVVRALDDLTTLELTVIDALVALGGVASESALRAIVNGESAEALERVRAAALVWGSDLELRAVSVLVDAVGTSMSRLGPSAATLLAPYGPSRVGRLAGGLGLTPTGDRAADIEAITGALPGLARRLIDEVDDRATAILEHLDATGQDGTAETTGRQASRSDVVGPVDQLLARGLVLARDGRRVAVPREVSIVMRGGRTTRGRIDDIPALATAKRDAMLVDQAAAGAAYEFVRHAELLLEQWGTSPPSVLRGGGLGVRELKAAGELLAADERVVALVVETSSAAGLLSSGLVDGENAWLPTDAFDAWRAMPPAGRWVRLATAWLDSSRLTGLIGSRLAGKPVNALGADLERGWLVETRRQALDEVAALTAGTVLAAGTGVPSLVERLRWLRPRRPADRAPAVGWVVEEASVIGVMGLGGVATHGSALLAGADAAAVLAPAIPEPVDHVLLQADLTAVAPGPLEQELARDLATVASVESRGGATVYRFTEPSVRHAYDAGWSSAEIHALLARASRTPVPQPLTYLVDDVARRFGTVRVGVAEAFVRSDDEAALLDLLRHPPLRLRRIAPTVLISDVPVDRLLPQLRDLGAAPVVEAEDGTVHVARREPRRARVPRLRAATGAARGAARVSAAVTAIRAGDRAADARPGVVESTTPADALARLRSAADTGSSVWIGYVDNSGATVERVVDPVRIEGGWLTAYDPRREQVRSFAIHRITAVAPVRG
ncbi:MAG: helicase C-terminal domain-containing protein [Nocardioidaceae bacterium]